MRQGILRVTTRVLRRRPALLCFPALGLGTVLLALAAAWPLLLQDVWHRAQHGQAPTPVQGWSIGVILAASSAAATIFTAALLHSVHALMDGRRPPLRTSLASAGRRIPTLLGWSLFSLLVGNVLRVGESTVGLAILFDALGISWTMLTFFMLPVIVVERSGLFTSLRRSLSLGTAALGGAISNALRVVITTLLVAVVAIVVLIYAVESDNLAVLFASAVAVAFGVLCAVVLNSAATGIYRTALYRRAVARPAE